MIVNALTADLLLDLVVSAALPASKVTHCCRQCLLSGPWSHAFLFVCLCQITGWTPFEPALVAEARLAAQAVSPV